MSLADALRGLKADAAQAADDVVREPATAPIRERRKEVADDPPERVRGSGPTPRAKKAVVASAAAAGIAKSQRPDYERANVYIASTTKRAAWRKWEDEGGEDFSDLVQKLLEEFLRT